MRVLVTVHAQMFRAPDGTVWTKAVYGYDFFKRYLENFEKIRIVTRMGFISKEETIGKLRVDGAGIEFFCLPHYHGPFEYAKNILKIKKLLKQSILNCDCAILRIPDQKAFQLFTIIKKEQLPCAIEVVAHPWDLFSKGNYKSILRLFLRKYWDRQQKEICEKSDGVAYVTKNYIQKRYPPKLNNDKQFTSHYTSADLEDYFFLGSRDQESFNKKSLTLIHVSTISSSAKGHSELLEALNILINEGFNYKLVLIGDGTKLEYYKKKAKELNLERNVDFLGNISSTLEISRHLKNADLFVFPSYSEGLPRSVIEAMATGLPCIATNVGGTSELINEKYLIEPKNVHEIVKKIKLITSSPENLVIESERNYTLARNSYSKQVVREKRKSFYRKLKDLVLISE